MKKKDKHFHQAMTKQIIDSVKKYNKQYRNFAARGIGPSSPQQAPQSFTSGGSSSGVLTTTGGGGLVGTNTHRVINMEKCIPNWQGQQQTVPVAGVYATLDGRTPNNNDIGTRIVYQHDPLEVVHIITGVQTINPQVGYVPTPWVTTNNPCGGGVTTPKTIIAIQCPLSPGLPYPHQFLARINGQSPNQSHLGQTIISQFPNGQSSPKFKVTAVTPPVSGLPGATVIDFNTTNAPCGQQQISGCTDPQAINFNPQATLDNGTCQYAPRPNPITPRPMDMMQDSDTSEAMSDIRKGRGLSDERMKRYKELRG